VKQKIQPDEQPFPGELMVQNVTVSNLAPNANLH